ncbi:MAG: ATP-binding protein [Prevotellaceae bacterium]|jgi:AAA+ ATPase superfamily predicted ATPase|nr:ATP-binding protein [Prevotellaceae bacterium]
MLKFYNREKEIALLREIEERALNWGEMTMLIGRRRVGKTTLLRNAFTSNTVLYFLVTKKTEVLLCDEFVRIANEKLSLSLGDFQSFAKLLKSLMIQSKTRHFTLIVDEFQDFAKINPSIFSEIQHVWDWHKDESKINLIFCGSIYSIMKKIFEHSKEPLFGRLTARIDLKPFTIGVTKQIFSEFNPNYKNEDLLAFYMVTGGIAKYMEQFLVNGAFTKKKIFASIFHDDSYFIEEGRTVLIDEFGSDYGNYFSILMLIASSKTSRSEIESIMNTSIGGFLDRLENEFGLIKKIRPFGAKPGGRDVKYRINDNFLSFWFRFVYKYRSSVEIGNLDYVRDIVERDYETYSGMILERYFRTKLIEEKQFSDIGNYWNRKGENEIDIVAVNDMKKRLVFYEIKRNANKINLSLLEKKSATIAGQYPDYTVEYAGLSIDDM